MMCSISWPVPLRRDRSRALITPPVGQDISVRREDHTSGPGALALRVDGTRERLDTLHRARRQGTSPNRSVVAGLSLPSKSSSYRRPLDLAIYIVPRVTLARHVKRDLSSRPSI